MAEKNLQDRLDKLDHRIRDVQKRMKLKGIFSSEHQVKATELERRYRALSKKLDAEIADQEAHGHHVSDLEKSIREWVDSLELKID